jgi:hypothetical protein
MRALIAMCLCAMIWTAAGAEQPAWVENMRIVHASFKGKAGTIAQYGDSISVTLAFFAPLQWEVKNPGDQETNLKNLRAYVAKECWNWKGPEHGNQGGSEAKWGLDGIDGWLKKHNPEIALIMWGTNDSKHRAAGTGYKETLGKLVDKVLANGTIPVLYTIPPRGDQAGNKEVTARMEEYVKAVRELAAEKKVPLIDFYKEILDRQPENFHTTLLGDALHPSYPKEHQNNFSAESLKQSGYTLRNYLTLKMFGEIFDSVLKK